MKQPNLNISTDVWFRESTNEWVIDLNISYKQEVNLTHRFSGATEIEALRKLKHFVI